MIQRVGLWAGLAVAALVLILSFFVSPPDGMTPAAFRLLAMTLLMSVWWMTEAIPLAATGLVPLAIFPMLGLATVSDMAPSYAHPVVLLLLGGFLLAIAVEESGVHRRIALKVLLLVGTSPRRLVLGFAIATAGISLWISNTATTLIMLPIALAIADRALERSKEDARPFVVALVLVLAYAASIGGMGTPVGTPTNLIGMGALQVAFPDRPPLTFVSWCLAGVPIVALLVPLLWLVLTFVYPRIPASLDFGEEEVVRRELAALGTWRPSEIRALALFAVTGALWVTRPDSPLSATYTLRGWESLLGLKGTDDAMVAMLAALAAFLIPAGEREGRLLSWQSATKLPWGLILLFGGGIALSGAFDSTGLSKFIGQKLALLAQSPMVFVGVSTLAATLLSEIMSNTALATILMPIMASTAKAAMLDPRMLLVPTALACSCGFMLPAATGPNAIVFGTGRLRVSDMVKAGLIIDLIGTLVIVLVCLITYG